MRVLIAGGAGFVGSHFVDHFIAHTDAEVTVFDNFSSGRRSHLRQHADGRRVRIVEGDLGRLEEVVAAMAGHDVVYHFASNPDIARAATEPEVDFWQGTYLTHNLLEAMRRQGVRRLVYASGSGVYGDTGETPVHEAYGPMVPISTYGASKLACEALIAAYCHMFDMQAWTFRFANVVGSRQTHGVAYDFVRKLRAHPRRLQILGDGSQSKSYIHVNDIVGGVTHTVQATSAQFDAFNLATGDYIDVSTIARLVASAMGIDGVEFVYAGGRRGWKGDVPVVRFDLAKVQALGWRARLTSEEAMRRSVGELLADLEQLKD